MTSEMVHPHLTDFVTQLFFNHKHPRSVCSVTVGDIKPLTITDLNLNDLTQTLILALQRNESNEVIYNPPRHTVLYPKDRVIAMSCQEEADALSQRLKGFFTRTI